MPTAQQDEPSARLWIAVIVSAGLAWLAFGPEKKHANRLGRRSHRNRSPRWRR